MDIGRYPDHLLLLLLLLFFSLALQQQQLGVSHAASTSTVLCHAPERDALMEFKRGLRDPSGRLSSWVGGDCCAWEGIGCSNITGHVLQLNLRNRKKEYLYGDCSDETSYYRSWDDEYGCGWALFGNTIRSLSHLKHLRHLDLSGNFFQQGPIPEFLGSLTRLTYLNLSAAGFKGKVPDQLGNLSHLHHLDLSYNFYTDDADDQGLYIENAGWISQLTSLRVLNMSLVKLRNASDWLRAMNALPHIQELRLADCGIVRFLPHNSLLQVNFTSLATLDLSSNDINSKIPWLFNLSSLEQLYLSSTNDLKWLDLASISKLSSLIELDLSYNVFQHGFITTALRNLCKLQTLSLQGADINDEITHLQGVFSGCLILSLEELYLGYTGLRGNLPDWLWRIHNLRHLDLSSNSLYGPIPLQLGSLSSLQYLDMSENNLYGTIAEGMFERMKGLICLNMRFNSLSLSEIDLVNLPAPLKYLYISSNTLVLNESQDKWIPPFQLEELDMSYCKILPKPKFPIWLQTQRVLSSLRLSDMRIKDTFPTWLPTTLTDLDLSNNFLSELPASLGRLFSLRYLNIRNNDLNGTIDKGIFIYMKGLIDLSIGGNSLSFSEVHIANLPATLKYLDISSNTLVLNENHEDWIPTFQLNSLQMSYCKILPEPKLPKWVQMQNALHSLYIGGNLFSLSEMHLNNLPNSLKRLDISSNILVLNESHEDWIPSFQLESLYMSYCTILPKPKFPKWLQTQRVLSDLRLSSTRIKDTFPTWLPTTIEILDLSNNSLSVLSSLGSVSSLQVLDIRSNGLNETIAEGMFGRMKRLFFLFLSDNSLYLSEVHLANLPSSLRLLDISFNTLLVNESYTDWIPPFQLEYLEMSSCRIFPIPQFPKWLQTQRALSSLYLSSTGIKDSFPTSLPTTLKYLDLSNNSFLGQIPSAINSIIPIISTLDLSMNNFTGSIPFSICQIKHLTVLRLSKNNFSGKLSNCWENTSEITILDLSSNYFQGGISDSICSQQNLLSLHLSHNNLSGHIPACLKNCKRLTGLDLSHNHLVGNIPTWIEENLLHLQVLNLRSNDFTGNISSGLSNLEYLQVLDLSNNKFSGVVPLSFGNFSALKGYPRGDDDDSSSDIYLDIIWLFVKGNEFQYQTASLNDRILDLSNNDLSGYIPGEVGDLNLLRSLNLSHNHLIGYIPRSIDGMKHLEVLDLSRNNLSGTIPPSLTTLNFLSILDLSYNNLSGRIPTGSQLQTFDQSSYIGNPNLCGFPLSKNCTNDIIKGDENTRNEDTAHKAEIIWLFGTFAMGFIIGFWIVCGTLVIKRRWRFALFRATDNLYDKMYVMIAVNLAKLGREQHDI